MRERERGAGLESCLSPTGAIVHGVLLFGGRMIDRKMRDGEGTALVSFPTTQSLPASLVKDL